jgi:hypothetical protein
LLELLREIKLAINCREPREHAQLSHWASICKGKSVEIVGGLVVNEILQKVAFYENSVLSGESDISIVVPRFPSVICP